MPRKRLKRQARNVKGIEPEETCLGSNTCHNVVIESYIQYEKLEYL